MRVPLSMDSGFRKEEEKRLGPLEGNSQLMRNL
ncbi:hypothetical protein SLEP1_g58647, partial [Rubroshorea leprosula]